LWDLLAQSLGKRRSPVFIAITTSGTGEESLCRQQNRYSEKVLSGVLHDDSWFAFICGIDPEDSYDDSTVWVKANPNLGISVKVKELTEAINKAKGDPASLNGVLRLRLGIWTQAVEAFIPMEEWELCNAPIDLDSLLTQPCFGGLDLSTTTDISALILLFPPYGDRTKWVVLPEFFLPKDCIEKRSSRDRVPYSSWARNNLFNLTSGNVIDYDAIRLKILELSEKYDIREWAIDPWNGTETSSWLQAHGFVVSPVRQGFQTLAGPTKRLLELIMTHDLAHLGNPVLRWMASNVIADEDATGSVKPDKTKSSEKIDGISALICALSRAMVVTIKPKKASFTPFYI
jgi:phage terminase large subunit-like protein